MQIYIGRNGQQQGPYSIEELNKLAQSEPITGNDMCWHKECADWIPLSQLAGFIPSPSPPPTAVPSAFQQKQPSTTSLPTPESGMGTNDNETLYYLVLDSEQAGPFTSGQLRAMWQTGKVNAQTKYCAAGGTSWRPLIDLRTMLESVPGQPVRASSPLPTTPSAVRQSLRFCASCGSQLAQKAAICPKCGVPTEIQGSHTANQISNNAGMRLLLPVGRSGWAIAAGYLGLFSVIGLIAPIAIVVSIIAIIDISKSKATNERKYGMGRAVFGLVMGIICTAVWAYFVVPLIASRN